MGLLLVRRVWFPFNWIWCALFFTLGVEAASGWKKDHYFFRIGIYHIRWD